MSPYIVCVLLTIIEWGTNIFCQTHAPHHIFLLTIIAKHRYKAKEQLPRPNNGVLFTSVCLLKYNLILIHKTKFILRHFLRVLLCLSIRGKLLEFLRARLLHSNLL